MSLSVVIPAFNEEKSIKQTLNQIKSNLNNIDHEIIVIDDNSSDNTSEIIESFKDVVLIRHEKNKGYGASIKSGINKSKFNFIAITDADGTYPNENILEFYKKLKTNNYDMIVGSRTGSNVNIPLLRRPPKWILGKLANYVVNQNIPDINSGLRIFKKKSFIKFITIIPDGFSLTTTITLGMISGGFNVEFEDIDYFKRSGKSKIRPIRDTINFFKLILRIGLYFSPKKIFMPISIILFLAAISWGLISKFYVGELADVSVLLLTIASFQTILFALIAELINSRLPNNFKK